MCIETGTALIGAPSDDQPNGASAGAAYVYEWLNGTWHQQAKLIAEDGDRDDQLGFSVAIQGGTAIVSAPGDEHPNGTNAGSAYVFERTGNTWQQVAKLVAEDGDADDVFGTSVAIDTKRALVGTPKDEDANGRNGGSTYVFESANGAWVQTAKFVADGDDDGDLFGAAVAVDEDTALVGAPRDEDPNGDGAGSAYVFEVSNGSWSQQAKLVTADGDATDQFGTRVCLDNGTALIGAPGDEDPNGDNSGSAYVYDSKNGIWSQQAKLTAEGGDSGDFFGLAVGLDDETALIGAPGDEQPNGTGAGSAYVFERANKTWSQQVKLAAEDGDSKDAVGISTTISGDTALVGAFGDEDPNGDGAGSAYVFVL